MAARKKQAKKTAPRKKAKAAKKKAAPRRKTAPTSKRLTAALHGAVEAIVEVAQALAKETAHGQTVEELGRALQAWAREHRS